MGYTYCISDVHGEFDRYQKIFDIIQFTDSDTMYVIGDVIDRNPGGIDIIHDIMSRPNVHLLMGNHELMCIQTLGSKYYTLGTKHLWSSNGGSVTRRELIYHISSADRREIIRYLESLPDHLDITVDGTVFHLVHGFPAETTSERVWNRIESDSVSPYPADEFLIVGHTPVCFLRNDVDKYFTDIIARSEHMRICLKDNIFDIDCGCGNPTDTRRLACLRLNDFEEFYV